jgi:hypothetical protein
MNLLLRKTRTDERDENQEPPISHFPKCNPGKGFQVHSPVSAKLPGDVCQSFFWITTPAAWQVFL